MKTKLFFLITLFLISFGCNEEKHGIELIQSENVYLPLSELDKYPELQSENMGKNSEDNINIHLQKVFQQLSDNDKQNFSAKYLFLINENGRVDKIQIIRSTSKKIDELFAKTVKDWKFTPAIKNGKNVKSISPWSFNPQFSKSEIISAGGDDIYFVAVEEMPEPIGGLYAIQSKIKYPEEAKRNGIEGKVFIQAFIDETGNIVEAKVIKGAGYGLDEAALDAVKQTKFIPGKQKGKPVKVQVSIPIVFKLESKITIEDILEKLKWNINQAEVIRVASNYLKVTDYKELKQKNSRSRVIQFTGGSLYGIKTDSWSFAFENDSLDIISIQFRSTSSSDKSKTYSDLKSEIEKVSLTKITIQPNEWILSFDNKSLARLQIYPGGRTTDIQILLSSNKFINEHSFK